MTHAPADIPSEDVSPVVVRGLILLWALSAPFLCVMYMMVEPSPDQMQFDYMAWLSIQGHPYYAGSFDMNWPGAMILHEIGIRLFGVHAWTWHLTDFLLLQGITIMIAWFLCLARLKLGALVFLALYPAAYVTAGGWLAGQRDIIAGGLILAACALLLYRGQKTSIPVIGAGVLIGYAVLIRPTFLSFAAMVALLELTRLPYRDSLMPERLKRAAAFCLGGILFFVIVAALALRVGNLDDWYQQSIVFALSIYAGNPPQSVIGNLGVAFFAWWHWMTLGAVIGVIVWLLHRRLDYPLALMAGAGATTLISYFFQDKGFIYHLGGFIPLMVLLSAAAINILWVFATRNGPFATGAKLLLVLTVLVCTLGAGKKLFNERERLVIAFREGVAQPIAPPEQRSMQETILLVELIRAGSQPEDPMVQYGIAYNVPYLAERKTSYRFINNAVQEMTPDFALYDLWLDEIEAGLIQDPPVFVLVESTTGTLPDPDPRKPVLTALLEHISEGYEVVLVDRFGLLLQQVKAR